MYNVLYRVCLVNILACSQRIEPVLTVVKRQLYRMNILYKFRFGSSLPIYTFFFFFFSFAYTTSPAAVMKLVVFFRSSKVKAVFFFFFFFSFAYTSSSGPPSPHIISGEAELLMASVRFALVGVCYISEEHARLSGPPHHRDTLGEGTIFSLPNYTNKGLILYVLIICNIEHNGIHCVPCHSYVSVCTI